MKNYRIILALGLAALATVSCGRKAVINCRVNEAPQEEIIVKMLNINTYDILDTVKTDKSGAFKYSVDVKKGQPEFIYLFKGDTKIASLLLEAGDKAEVVADTLGNYTVAGSENSEKLMTVEKNFAQFMNQVRVLLATSDNSQAEISRLYISYYRDCIKYLVENPYSLTTIPVLYEKINDESPIFSQQTDAIHFRRVCDSLKTVYPESKYVAALEKETARRENLLALGIRINDAFNVTSPDIVMPDVNGVTRSLNELGSKVVLLHFWTSTDATHKMMNAEILKPIYRDYHNKGLEIFSVCVDMNKAAWAQTVKLQGLDWINVNDGLGTSSAALAAYNITSLPTTFLICDGTIANTEISGEASLRKELSKLLK